MTTCEKAEMVAAGLLAITELMGADAFYGRGQQGPQWCMTDDCDAEDKALRTAWPQTRRLLCTFHIGQVHFRIIGAPRALLGPTLILCIFTWLNLTIVIN